MIENLRLFVRIIERGGLAVAGRELGYSPASVSERLSALERHYGCTLLQRSTRSFSLTEEGRVLLEGARRLVSDAEALNARLRSGVETVSGPVRISAPVDFGRSTLVPLLDQYLARYPDVSLDLELDDGYTDLVGRGFDLAIRYGALEDSRMKARRLGTNRRIVCAAPAYLDRKGIPATPADLEHHECIIMRFGANIDNEWPFMVGGKLKRVHVTGRRILDDGHLAAEWCRQGHGLTLKSIWDVSRDLKTGVLVEVLESFSPPDTALQLVFPQADPMPRRVRLLADSIATHCRLQVASFTDASKPIRDQP